MNSFSRLANLAKRCGTLNKVVESEKPKSIRYNGVTPSANKVSSEGQNNKKGLNNNNVDNYNYVVRDNAADVNEAEDFVTEQEAI